ncbi:VWA domain-containing protein [Aporhodopirellula aestuarii]|uniref:VWA domain-containing protein n=1 Tax=Aporhodopirellula aestuarii TaxID=2950107 RepID=A0ABT0UBY0_9BACT|nr:vWA domain-containing protein [Aporhodopirellula aestuarii]MCM2374524.1 VWA domain-containing protein [Aporhodopirellula aestuarii]
MSSPQSRSRFVSVSNGIEFLLIPRSELPKAEANGYYRPESRGLMILEKDGRLFEVPVEKGGTAEHQGYRDVLSRERRKSNPAKEITSPDTTSNSPVPTLKAPTTDSAVEVDNATPPKIEQPKAQPQPAESPQPQTIAPLSMVAAIERSEREAEELRLEQQRQIEEQTGWRKEWLRFQFWFAERRDAYLRQLGTNSISVLIHVAIVLMLASFYLVNPEKQKFVIVAAPSSSDNVVEEFTIETEPIEITEPTEEPEADSAPVEEVVPDVTETATTPDFLSAVNFASIKPPTTPAKASTTPGTGIASVKGKPTFFGSKFAAINNVFVIDNSNSMTRGRFETALIQLMLTVNQLTPKQRFYVIFYSDTAYGMMHPNTVPNLVAATPRNKALLANWLDTVPLCLRTNGKKAIQIALDLKPDVIYVLGDGAFTDGAAQYFASRPNPNIVIHTRGMEVQKKDAAQFELLATSHKGNYRDVGVMPEGAAMAQRYPRPRNSTRGPIWGIMLKPK